MTQSLCLLFSKYLNQQHSEYESEDMFSVEQQPLTNICFCMRNVFCWITFLTLWRVCSFCVRKFCFCDSCYLPSLTFGMLPGLELWLCSDEIICPYACQHNKLKMKNLCCMSLSNCKVENACTYTWNLCLHCTFILLNQAYWHLYFYSYTKILNWTYELPAVSLG